jgi:hypothetical protein
MQKINKILLAILILSLTISCGRGFKYTKIWEEKDCQVFYINSMKLGERVKSTLTVDDETFRYNIYIGYKGLPIHIMKFREQKDDPKTLLDNFRNMEFLVSDTSKNSPNYFGNEVRGYYDEAYLVGRYALDKSKKKVSPVSAKEYEMLRKIALLLADKQVEFQPVDSLKVMGWFKYEF